MELEALAIVMQVAILKLPTVKQENSLTSQERIAIIFSDCVVQRAYIYTIELIDYEYMSRYYGVNNSERLICQCFLKKC